MFPLTHVAACTKVLTKENQLTVFGSIFPDCVSYLGIGRNVGHCLGQDLFRHAAENQPKALDFAIATLLHGTSLPGLDYFADEGYHNHTTGFCFMEGEKLAIEVEKICNVPSQMALWKAHNFIEMGFDVITAEKHPDLGKRMESYLFDESFPFYDYLEDYLNVPQRKIAEMFRVVPRQFCFDGTDILCLGEKYLASLKQRHGIVGATPMDAARIIEKAATIVEPQYHNFMQETTTIMKDSLLNLAKGIGVKLP